MYKSGAGIGLVHMAILRTLVLFVGAVLPGTDRPCVRPLVERSNLGETNTLAFVFVDPSSSEVVNVVLILDKNADVEHILINTKK